MALYDSIIITGAGGMLGHALTDLLTSRGLKPISLTRAQCDVSNDEHIAHLFSHRPTLVLNAAAHTKVDLCEKEPEKADAINGYAVGKLARGCRDCGATLVQVGTDFVFDGQQRIPYKPNDPVHATCAYGKSKLLGETELQKTPPARWLIVRTAWVYGRHGANFAKTMVNAARAGKPLAVVNDQFGSPTYAPDLAQAIVDLLDAGQTGIWHSTNSGEITWWDFANGILEEFGVPREIKPISSADWMKIKPDSAYRPPYTVLDISGIAKLTGKPMRPWREALADYRRAVEAAGGQF
jgi:dTDP-4-dehydrorhamnose reductase